MLKLVQLHTSGHQDHNQTRKNTMHLINKIRKYTFSIPNFDYKRCSQQKPNRPGQKQKNKGFTMNLRIQGSSERKSNQFSHQEKYNYLINSPQANDIPIDSFLNRIKEQDVTFQKLSTAMLLRRNKKNIVNQQICKSICPQISPKMNKNNASALKQESKYVISNDNCSLKNKTSNKSHRKCKLLKLIGTGCKLNQLTDSSILNSSFFGRVKTEEIALTHKM